MNLDKKIEEKFSDLLDKSRESNKKVTALLTGIGELNGGVSFPQIPEKSEEYFLYRIEHALDRQAVYYVNALTANISSAYLSDRYLSNLSEDNILVEDNSTPANAFVSIDDNRIKALRSKPTGTTYFKQFLSKGDSLAPRVHRDAVLSELLGIKTRLESHRAGERAPAKYTTKFMLENFDELSQSASEHETDIAVRDRDRVSILYNSVYFDQLLESIKGASRSISVLMFFFPYDGRRTSAVTTGVFRALVAANDRGVDVTVVLDRDAKGQKYFTRKINANTIRALRRAGVNARFDSIDKVTHSKIVTVDNRYTFIGAHNLSNSSSYRYEEISLYVDSRGLAKHYTDLIETSE